MSAVPESGEEERIATLGTLLHATVSQLAATSPSARLDAELLLAHSLGRPRSYPITHAGEAVAPAVGEEVRKLVERRLRGEPMAHILGRREFWSLDLEIDARVLIPRPETERLVEFALEVLAPHTHAKVLDLGTGSGAVALAIARERPEVRVTATDVSPAALVVACNNAEQLGIGNVTFLAGDWYEPVGAMHFDLIVANPPYIAGADAALNSGDVRWEPKLALTPGPSGLEAIERIAERVRAHLRPGGWLAVEHGADQAAAVASLFSRQGLSTIRTLKDLAGHERVTAGRN